MLTDALLNTVSFIHRTSMSDGEEWNSQLQHYYSAFFFPSPLFTNDDVLRRRNYVRTNEFIKDDSMKPFLITV